jgi:hypothetical protein
LENHETSDNAAVEHEQQVTADDVNYRLRESRTGDYRGVLARFCLRSSRASRCAALAGGRPRSRPRARSPRRHRSGARARARAPSSKGDSDSDPASGPNPPLDARPDYACAKPNAAGGPRRRSGPIVAAEVMAQRRTA